MLLDNRDFNLSKASESDVSRRRIVGMVLCVYVLLIVEGALRKWAFPEFGQALYFVRDPFVFVIYCMALTSGYWPRNSPWLTAALTIAGLSMLVAMLQLAVGFGNPQSPLLFAAYGLRNYFFYVPLAFIIAETFLADDLRRVVAITLILAACSAGLVLLQFYSPLDSPINVGSSDNPLLQFRGLGLTGDRTRPMGFFTSDAGQKQLVITSFAMVLAVWSGVFSRVGYFRLLLPVATLAVLACLSFSGSRGAVLGCGLVVVAAIIAIMRGGADSARGRMLLVLTLIGILVAVLVPLLFADGLAAFLERWAAADSVESKQFSGGIFGRTLYGFVDFIRLVGGTPLIGYGIGMAGNAGSMFLAQSGSGAPAFSAETDWARHMVDLGPILGLIFILFRVGLVVSLARSVLASRSVLATLLFGYLVHELLLGQITGQGTINGYAWLFTGFTLAAANMNQILAKPESIPLVQAQFPNLMR